MFNFFKEVMLHIIIVTKRVTIHKKERKNNMLYENKEVSLETGMIYNP